MSLPSLILDTLRVSIYPPSYVDAIRKCLQNAAVDGQLIYDDFSKIISLNKNVFLATTRHGIPVVIKYLLSEGEKSAYRIVNALPPIPGVVRYYGIYDASIVTTRGIPAIVRSNAPTPFLFMEYVPGNGWEKLSPETRQLALFQLVNTLSLLKKSSFIHDDLAARNIIIRVIPEPVLLTYEDYQIVSNIVPTLIDLGSGRGSFGNWQQYLQDFVSVAPSLSDATLLHDLATKVSSRYPVFFKGTLLNVANIEDQQGSIRYDPQEEIKLLPLVANKVETSYNPAVIRDKLIYFERRSNVLRNDRAAWEKLDAEFLAYISNPQVVAGDVENRIPFLVEDFEEIRTEE
jgi:serine/threonine protein kinase